jgi:hypothetical protein
MGPSLNDVAAAAATNPGSGNPIETSIDSRYGDRYTMRSAGPLPTL